MAKTHITIDVALALFLSQSGARKALLTFFEMKAVYRSGHFWKISCHGLTSVHTNKAFRKRLEILNKFGLIQYKGDGFILCSLDKIRRRLFGSGYKNVYRVPIKDLEDYVYASVLDDLGRRQAYKSESSYGKEVSYIRENDMEGLHQVRRSPTLDISVSAFSLAEMLGFSSQSMGSKIRERLERKGLFSFYRRFRLDTPLVWNKVLRQKVHPMASEFVSLSPIKDCRR